MNRKIIIIFIVAAILILALIAYFALRGTPMNSGTGTGGNLPPIATGTTSFNGSSTASIPSGSTFEIGTSKGTVTVNNFYKTMDYITHDQQTVVLAENEAYTVVYNRSDSGFIIGILAEPLQAARDAAEAAFLNQLEVSKSDACNLTVDERVLDTNSPYDGELIGLSFCPGAIQLSK